MTWVLIVWGLNSGQVAIPNYQSEADCFAASAVAVPRARKAGVRVTAWCIPGPS